MSWGGRHDQRAQALNGLRNVLQQAKDLDGYVAQLDQQVAESGLENPIVRKALGEVFMARKDFAKAILNLRRAVATQPDDADSNKLLVSAYDANQDAEGALRQLLAAQPGHRPGARETMGRGHRQREEVVSQRVAAPLRRRAWAGGGHPQDRDRRGGGALNFGKNETAIGREWTRIIPRACLEMALAGTVSPSGPREWLANDETMNRHSDFTLAGSTSSHSPDRCGERSLPFFRQALRIRTLKYFPHSSTG